MKKLSSAQIANDCLVYNSPIDFKYLRWRFKKVPMEEACGMFIDGYCEDNGLIISKKMRTYATAKLMYKLREIMW